MRLFAAFTDVRVDLVALCGAIVLASCTSAPSGDEAADLVDPPTSSRIAHLVVVVQENHSFDAYFGRYCTALVGSEPACTVGPECCERGPDAEPSGMDPFILDDSANAAFDPRHDRPCLVAEIDRGAMDRFTRGVSTVDSCSSPRNFAYGDATTLAAYHDLARNSALADRYFQPIAGSSSANDVFFARAGFEFDDAAYKPMGIGSDCTDADVTPVALRDATIATLLSAARISWRFYGEGYDEMVTAASAGRCPAAPIDCPEAIDDYPCIYDTTDNPFAYFTSGTPSHFESFAAFERAISGGLLPSVSFVKAIGYKTEHPGSAIAPGVAFVGHLVDEVAGSSYANDTLVLVTWDESGGFFDHVKPPAPSAFDHQPYGPRIPLIAVGRFARKNVVSHVVMEHSSIVKFIEWNWLGATGQLGTRDGEVANIGSMLDPAETGAAVPER
jgi:phospholipase C